MKAKKIALAVAAALVLVQIVYSLGGLRSPARPRSAGAVPAWPRAEPGDIVGITLSRGGGGGPVELSLAGNGWSVDSLSRAPADAEKVNAFLATVLTAERLPLDAPEEGGEAPETGLDPEEGVLVRLRTAAGELPGMVIGLQPEGRFDHTYVKATNARQEHVLAGDLRGNIGLFRNQPGVDPDSRFWLQLRVLSFDPASVVGLDAQYPDHRAAFVRDGDGAWSMTSASPSGSWDMAALQAWLADLADFRIADVPDSFEEAQVAKDAITHTLTIRLADGSEKWIGVSPNRMGEGMRVATSDYPDRVFFLPEWRFKLYFQRLATLFPGSVPTFDPADVRFLDLRRGAVSMKLSRRDAGWRAVALPYVPDNQAVDRLIKLLAGWTPEDYAEVGDRPVRPVYGGPLLEVTLANGDVHQYRLGGRHPVFPWRYVTVDGLRMFSIADSGVAAMFPEFADVVDLGLVFPNLSPEAVTLVELSNAETGVPFVTFRKMAEGDAWEAVAADGRINLSPEEVDGMVRAPVAWKVAGIPEKEGASQQKPMFRLRVARDGKEQAITILLPQGRDMPFVADGGATLLLGRTDFFPWLGGTREIVKKIAPSPAAQP